MVYFVKGKYKACTVIMRERSSSERYYDFEMIIDCNPVDLYDKIKKALSNDHTQVTKIEIENIIKLS